MTNPNNCDTCNYKKMRSAGDTSEQHCYMFQDAPTEQCMQHTGRNTVSEDWLNKRFKELTEHDASDNRDYFNIWTSDTPNSKLVDILTGNTPTEGKA